MSILVNYWFSVYSVQCHGSTSHLVFEWYACHRWPYVSDCRIAGGTQVWREIRFFSATVSQEGLLWFQNLSIADPYGLLSVCFLIPSLINITVSKHRGIHHLHGSSPARKVQWHRQSRCAQSTFSLCGSHPTWDYTSGRGWLLSHCLETTSGKRVLSSLEDLLKYEWS